jgi:5,10-methylenetetrahydrofolate reductase
VVEQRRQIVGDIEEAPARLAVRGTTARTDPQGLLAELASGRAPARARAVEESSRSSVADGAAPNNRSVRAAPLGVVQSVRVIEPSTDVSASAGSFRVICEVEPPTRPDLKHVRHQIGVLSKISDSFLIPDNHIGRATVSSVAVAHEVGLMGGRSIACLNARDRNLLGFRRDLLTAAAYGVDEFLFVFGDRPSSGARTGQLTVRSMIEEVRSFPFDPAGGPFRVGVTAGSGGFPAWKRDADFVFVQVSFSLADALKKRAAIDFDGRVYAGVMVVPSAAMAAKLAADVAQLAVPDRWVDAVVRDPSAGVDLACELVAALRASGAYDGVHLIPVNRYREVAARLERDLR